MATIAPHCEAPDDEHPMNFDPSVSQRQLCERVKEFGETLNSDMVRRDAESVFDRDIWKRCAEFGIVGFPIPKEYGGSGYDLLTTLLAMEALGKACRDNGMVFAQNAQMWAFQLPLLTFGTDDQKQTYLPPLCRGDMVAAHAVTEPGAGSDVTALTTSYVRDGDEFVINGEKSYCTNAPVADVILAFASKNPAFKAAGISGFLIERGTPGMTQSPRVDKMGVRTAQMGNVTFKDCRVPVSSLLGREGQGFSIFSSAMEWERACIFASHLGSMERLLEHTIAFAKQRKQFGQSISKFDSIAHKLVDMKVNIEAGRLLLYKVASKKDSGQEAVLEAAMAKLFVSEAHVKQAFDAIQVFGGKGYCTEFEIERELRDAVSGTIYSGTSEMQRKIIARVMEL